jgi:hypothetical protein
VASGTSKGIDITSAAAWAIIDAERVKQDAKTARLRKARLDREGAQVAAPDPLPAKKGRKSTKRK